MRPWVIWMFLAALALVGVHAALASWNTARVEADAQRVITTQQALHEVDTIRSRIAEAEGEQRNYLITGDPTYRFTVIDKLDEVRAALPAMREGVRGYAAAEDGALALESAVLARIDLMHQGMKRRDDGGVEAAVQWLQAGDGRGAMEVVRNEAATLELILEGRMEEDRRRTRKARWTAQVSLVASTLVVGLFLVGTYGLIRREGAHRAAATEALGRSQERLRVVVDNLPLILLATDRTGVITLAEGRGLHALGKSSEEIVGRLIFDVCEDSPPLLANVRRALAGDSFASIVTLRDRAFHSWYAPRRDALGHLDGMLGVSSDITGQLRAEQELRKLTAELERRVTERTAQLEAANRELESFSYSVSHDLRAPLRSIDGFSAALQEECGETLPDSGKAYLDRVRAAARRMAQLIDDLLKLSRVSRSELNREEVDLSQMAHTILDDLARAAPDRKVRVEVEPGLTAQADPRLVRILLENLLGNAWKFTSKREDAHVAFRRVEHEGPPAFQVADNGAGFDMAFADRLFGPFQRLHGPSEFEGTGIGLATVQRIVNRHGGRVWAEAAVGKGARFSFTLEP